MHGLSGLFNAFDFYKARGEPVSKGERGIWQRRFWEHCIRSEADYRTHIDHMHINPVEHGYVERVQDWHYSSFHRFVADGLLPAQWGD